VTPGAGIKVRAAAVLVRKSRVLLVEHHKGTERYWVLPGGGVEPGENAARTVERELKEELGLRVKTGKFLFCDEVVFGRKHNLDLYFSCRLAGGTKVRLEKGSCVSGYGFFGAGELKRLKIRPRINAVLAELLTRGPRPGVFLSHGGS
jgi:8-oxo-dGTP pyrophosphatase MutT (NUDIX family)